MEGLARRVLGALRVDARTIRQIRADPNAVGQAATVIVIGGVASLIGNIRYGVTFGSLNFMVSLIGSALFVSLVVLIGTKVLPGPSPKVDFQEAFGAVGFSASPALFNVFDVVAVQTPLRAFVLAVWMTIIAVVATREVLNYPGTGRAVLVCAAAMLIYWFVIFGFVRPLFVAAATFQNI